jgi:hypothetical protein
MLLVLGHAYAKERKDRLVIAPALIPESLNNFNEHDEIYIPRVSVKPRWITDKMSYRFREDLRLIISEIQHG